MKQRIKHDAFSIYSFCVWCLSLLVILWGAWVRISFSGDGCGKSWPTCAGQYVLSAKGYKDFSPEVWTEWTHRASSGLFLLAVLVLCVWVFLRFPAHRKILRKTSVWVLGLTLVEALIGAVLVLWGLTGQNDSPLRAGVMGGHIINSVLLSSLLFVLWRLSLSKTFSFFTKKSFYKDPFLIFTAAGAVVMSLGALSSLSATLFPSPSLWEGMMWDFSHSSHFLIRLRVWHPLLATGFVMGVFYILIQKPITKERGFFAGTLIFALLSGMGNLLFLSPVVLKLLHLLAVHLLAAGFLLTREKTQHTAQQMGLSHHGITNSYKT